MESEELRGLCSLEPRRKVERFLFLKEDFRELGTEAEKYLNSAERAVCVAVGRRESWVLALHQFAAREVLSPLLSLPGWSTI